MVRNSWTDLDDKAVAIARALAADSVQKVGNGHPGTAMSLAPVAYTLFQRFLKHDPTQPQWLGRDRFVLSCGHSSLTLYIQLFLSGYGLSLDDLKSFRKFCEYNENKVYTQEIFLYDFKHFSFSFFRFYKIKCFLRGSF